MFLIDHGINGHCKEDHRSNFLQTFKKRRKMSNNIWFVLISNEKEKNYCEEF